MSLKSFVNKISKSNGVLSFINAVKRWMYNHTQFRSFPNHKHKSCIGEKLTVLVYKIDFLITLKDKRYFPPFKDWLPMQTGVVIIRPRRLQKIK